MSSPERNSPNSLRPRWAIILLLALTVVFSFPLCFHLSNHLIGGRSDAWQFPWNTYIFRQQIAQGQNPYFTDSIFTPVGTSLLLHSYTEWISIVGLPLSPFLNEIAQTNLAILLSTFLSGLGAFLLARDLTKNVWAALFAGIAFAFCPFRMARVTAHVNFALTQWLPLGIWSLFRMMETRQWKYVWWTALFIALNQYSNQYFTIYLILTIFLILSAGFLLFPQWQDVRLLRKLIPAAMITVVFLSPQILPMYQEFRKAGIPSREGGELLATKTSAGFRDYLSATSTNPLLRKLGISSNSTVTSGWTVLVLGIVGIGAAFQDRNRKLILMVLVGIFFLILSLGPELPVGLNRVIPLPYSLMLKIPGVNHVRIPYRFGVMVTLTLALTAAYAISRWRGSVWLPIACCAILLLELSPIPLQTKEYRPPAYFRSMGLKDGGVLLTLPFGFEADASLIIRDQIFHKKKLLNGRLSRMPAAQYEYFTSIPVLQTFFSYTKPGHNPKRNVEEDQQSSSLFRKFFNVRYVAIYPPFSQRQTIRQYILQIFPDAKFVGEESKIRFYELPGVEQNNFAPAPGDPGMKFFLYENWEAPARESNSFLCRTGQASLLMPYTATGQRVSGILTLRSRTPAAVRIRAGNSTLLEATLSDAFTPFRWNVSDQDLQNAHHLLQLDCNSSSFELQSLAVRIE